MTEIAQAEAVVAELQRKRSTLIAERRELDGEIKRLAYLAHAQHDPEAKLSLTELRAEAIRCDQRQREVEIAIEQLKNSEAA